jgi:arylsulfatase A-like enzyme
MYFGTAMSLKTPNIHILDILFASPIMIYGTVLGPSIGGEGIREIIFALLLGKMAGPAKAVLFAHLGFWVGEILSLAGGIIYILRPAEYRPQVKEMQDVLKASEKRIAEESFTADELSIIKSNMKERIVAGIWMGIWAGFLTGLLEALVVILSFPTFGEITVLYYSPVLYGIFGGIGGLGLGIVMSCFAVLKPRIDRKEKVWAFCFVAVFIPLCFIIARFRIIRDLLHEKPLSLSQTIMLMLLFAMLFLLLFWIIQKLFKSASVQFFAKGFVSIGLWIIFIGGAFIFSKTFFAEEKGSPITWLDSSLKPSPNVVLIIVDALRAEHLSCYGYRENKTPNIDNLAKDGILFTRHFAQSSWTKPQVATMLTSLYPSTHQTYLKPHTLPDTVETIAEAMKKLGYATGGIVSNVNLSPLFNFHQGFDYFRYLGPNYFFFARESSSKLCLYNFLRLVRERFLFKKKYVYHYYQDGNVVNQKAFAWLDEVKGSPFFLWLHYMEPHDPYFSHPYNGQAVARVSTPNPPSESATMIRSLYDGEITYCDVRIGEFLNFLKEHGMYDDCLILLTADHGEEFYDHGGWWHGTTLYEEQVHIPLIMKLPGNKRKGTIDNSMVRSLEIAPTILDAVGSNIPAAMQGTSLLHTKKEIEQAMIFSEENHENNIITALRTDKWKLILTKEGSPRMAAPVQLFDLQSDPEETQNLASTYPEVVNHLSAEIAARARAAQSSAYEAQQTEIDTATREKLKALGYVE